MVFRTPSLVPSSLWIASTPRGNALYRSMEKNEEAPSPSHTPRGILVPGNLAPPALLEAPHQRYKSSSRRRVASKSSSSHGRTTASTRQ